MTERSLDSDQNAAPEDIATLYSRANMEGTRYWDFSASRKKVRGQFHHRMALEEAERAGAPQQPLPPLLRQASEQLQAPQLQVPQFPAAHFEQQARSGPVRVPGTVAQTEMREIPASRVAAPWRERPTPAPERAPTRWFGLQSVFSTAQAAAETPPEPQMSSVPRPPMVAVFSLAGGVGKTCLVATLGRALSSLGEQVLLADTAAFGLLPFYFGSRESKPGVVRTFLSPPRPDHGGESEAPVHVLSLKPEYYPGDGGQDDALLGELVKDGRGASRIMVDIATASSEVTSRLLRLRPTVLVPLLPDMSSLASLVSLEAFLTDRDREAAERLYLLNQFDTALPLHQDMREMLQQQLGDRLLPLVLRRSPAVSEALVEGMTVIDYAPGSTAAEDYWALAGWLRSFAAPAIVGYGGVRWSER
jgi:cellulose synthase operon protein YhjQ